MLNRHNSLLDRLLIAVDNSMRTLFASPISQRPNPAKEESGGKLYPEERKKSGALMRINHTGEVCAQALYYGQAVATRSEHTKQSLLQAAEEETDHLAWCEERLRELNVHTSYLNPLWYLSAFSVGLLAGMVSDRWSLGFVVETERQVGKHLQNHIELLPPEDTKSRLILEQMREDEAHHATVAMGAGAIELPDVIKTMMNMMSKVMTKTTYYL
jgi:3-demethoxyubiquinol 3-hydroxylase